jgi:hypothetical protein
VLRVRALRHTVELLRLGGAIEALPGVSALSLVRGEPGDAWFAATLPTSGRSRLEQAQALADALIAMPGYRIAALATEIGVELDVAPLAEQPQLASPPAVAPEPAPAPSSAAPPAEAPALPFRGRHAGGAAGRRRAAQRAPDARGRAVPFLRAAQ